MSEGTPRKQRFRHSGAWHIFTRRLNPDDASPSAFRLETRDEAANDRIFFAPGGQPEGGRRRKRLTHYISAGGMRQTRRTLADDIREERRRRFLIFAGLVAAAWILFYFLPV
ncbi:MAG: hypothetical protein J6U40_07350 [Kiritimatiellae bacterium]|nr:hypothetical protein [Kiritimatiellia bacterium]